MFYSEPMIKDTEGAMWAVVAHTMHGIVVETARNSELVRGLVGHAEAREYSDGHVDGVRVYGLVRQEVVKQ